MQEYRSKSSFHSLTKIINRGSYMLRPLNYLIVLLLVFMLSTDAFGLVYLNRRLLECEPLTYVVEPIELVGESMSISRGYQNDYGYCTGLTPGPPFIIEMPVSILNEYNPDGSILHYGSFTIQNGIKNDAGQDETNSVFEVVLEGPTASPITIYNEGIFSAIGMSSDMVEFKGFYRIVTNYSGGPISIPRQDYYNIFKHCIFQGSMANFNGNCLSFEGGHLTMENCRFEYFDAQNSQFFKFQDPYDQGYWDVSLKECQFHQAYFNVLAPVWIHGAGTLELENIHFNNVILGTPVNVDGLMECTSINKIEKHVKNISSSNCNIDGVFFNNFGVYDSIYLQNEVPLHLAGSVDIDSGGTLVIDKGSIIQFHQSESPLGATIVCDYGSLIVDSSILTGINDNEYGYDFDHTRLTNYSIPNWHGIYVSDSSTATINNSLIRLTYEPIEAVGDIEVDSTSFQLHIGNAFAITGRGGHEHTISNCIIDGYGTGSGIDYSMDFTDNAPERLTITNTKLLNCYDYGIEVLNAMYQPKPFDIFINDCIVAGNDNGIKIDLGPETDTVQIQNCYIAATEGSGIYFQDRNGDSAQIRLESNIIAGNVFTKTVNTGVLTISTGKADIVNNSILWNKGYGILHTSTADYASLIYNNIFAHNGNRGYYHNSSNGVPNISYNDFFDNDIDGNEDVYIRVDGSYIYTFEELVGLGGTAVYNKNYEPGFIKPDTGRIDFITYDTLRDISKMYVPDFSMDGRSYEGTLIRPDYHDSAWYYISNNENDTIYILGDIRDYASAHDTFLISDPHLALNSPLVDSGFNTHVSTIHDFEGDDRIIDAGDDDIGQVDIGGDEYRTGMNTSNGAILVFSPMNDSLYRPGEMMDIYWECENVNYLQILYACDYDSYATSDWEAITVVSEPDDGHFQWEVPDTFSYRTRILLVNGENSSEYAESGVFHIKPTVLTRVKADSTYEKFKITEDNWQFANDDANMWPSSWYAQFNYQSGLDVYTGNAYPAYFSNPPVNALSADFPDWGLYVGTFGTDQCYMYVDGSLHYRQRAIEYWMDIKDSWGGSCYGLSNSAMMAFGDSAVFRNVYPAVGTFGNLYPVTMTDNRRIVINRFMTCQFGQEATQHMDTHENDQLQGVVEDLKNVLGNNKTLSDLGTITICDFDHPDTSARGCHNIVPYKLEKHMSDPDKFWIYVYDCNIPTDSATRILVDTSLNYWTYDSLTWDSYQKLWIESPLHTFITRPTIPGIEGGDKNASPFFYLYFSNADSLHLESSLYGSATFSGTQVSDSLTIGTPLYIRDKFGRPPFGFYLPSDSWLFSLNGDSNNFTRLSMLTENSFITYYRDNINTGEIDNILYNGDDTTLWVYNNDGIIKEYGMRLCYEDTEENEYLMQCKGIETSPGDSTCFKLVRQMGYTIQNYGNASTYLLELSKLAQEGFLEFADSSITINSNTAHIIYPIWGVDYIEELIIDIDNGIDGTVDDSLILINNIPLDADDDLGQLPDKFNVAQNYPNPFNPTTTIEFSLPERSQVRITVYNLLGQVVTRLVNKELPAGYHEVVWDSKDDNGHMVGSGVYLYRMEAGDFVKSYKMMLIK